jgi:hypothetical protein
MRSASFAATLALVAVLTLAPVSARAEEESLAYTGLVGVGTVICTLIYSPIKVAYAATGLVVSGLAWMWTMGDTDVSGRIYSDSVGGDYVLMPSHLEGREDPRFTGR